MVCLNWHIISLPIQDSNSCWFYMLQIYFLSLPFFSLVPFVEENHLILRSPVLSILSYKLLIWEFSKKSGSSPKIITLDFLLINILWFYLIIFMWDASFKWKILPFIVYFFLSLIYNATCVICQFLTRIWTYLRASNSVPLIFLPLFQYHCFNFNSFKI